MAKKKKPAVFTLIGDIVDSRSVQDRSDLQQRLTDALAEMNQALEPLVPLEVTIGDEFQACFDNSGVAVRASLIVRLELLRSAGIDSRYGLGAGEVEVFSQRRPVSQDGPGWWAARDAVEQVQRFAASPHTAFARTFFRAGTLAFPETEAASTNAFLLCRDAMVDRMKQSSRNRLYGLMRGWSQSRIAAEEGATQGAISQSLSRSGAFAILAAQDSLEGRLL
jgi:hypothetical protein